MTAVLDELLPTSDGNSAVARASSFAPGKLTSRSAARTNVGAENGASSSGVASVGTRMSMLNDENASRR